VVSLESRKKERKRENRRRESGITGWARESLRRTEREIGRVGEKLLRRRLVPREWNTDQYQQPRRAPLCLFSPTPSTFGDLVLSRAFDESAREKILPIS